ncbi:MAG: adenylate/guanylate cyclase domain-containing protein [Candidatus Nanoarchaeia archaeon]
MTLGLNQFLFIILLLLSFYGMLKSWKVYKKRREPRYLFVLVLFLIITPQLWVKAYGIRLQEFLQDFQFVLTLVPIVIFVIYNYVESKRVAEHKEKQRIKNYFGRYVSPKVISRLLAKKKIQVGGERRYLTIFFMDIRGFTSMSEGLEPEEVVKVLNKYFNIVNEIIFKHHGTVDKFIGDAVMAVWNAPTDEKDHELKALKSAKEIQKAIIKWGRIEVGIGIHAGDAISGNIGSKHMMDYTAIGDAVNTASRLEGQTKAGDIVISRSVYDKVKKQHPTKQREKVSVKGKREALEIFRYSFLKPGPKDIKDIKK